MNSWKKREGTKNTTNHTAPLFHCIECRDSKSGWGGVAWRGVGCLGGGQIQRPQIPLAQRIEGGTNCSAMIFTADGVGGCHCGRRWRLLTVNSWIREGSDGRLRVLISEERGGKHKKYIFIIISLTSLLRSVQSTPRS